MTIFATSISENVGFANNTQTIVREVQQFEGSVFLVHNAETGIDEPLQINDATTSVNLQTLVVDTTSNLTTLSTLIVEPSAEDLAANPDVEVLSFQTIVANGAALSSLSTLVFDDKAVPAPASGRFYIHLQPIPSNVWSVTHNLGYNPSVTVIDTSGEECVGHVKHNSVNQLTISFSAGFAGTAHIV